MFFKGRGYHSVKELEDIIEFQKEEIHKLRLGVLNRYDTYVDSEGWPASDLNVGKEYAGKLVEVIVKLQEPGE